MTSPWAFLRAVRPRQWSKNLLILAAPVAAGVAFQSRTGLGIAVAVLAFILASSGVYLVNNAVDAEADRVHPTKRLRPVAAGELSARDASTAAVVVLAGGLAVAAVLGWQLLLVVALYEAIQILYCLRLQYVPVLELLSVASGFLLRAIAGGVATGVVLSPWFLVAIGSGSLFVAAGKRASEILLAESATAAIRPVLARYSWSRLRLLWRLSAAVLLATYGLWSVTVGRAGPNPWSVMSILPLAVVVVRYGRRIDAGDAGQPEEVILGDGVMLVLITAWTACFIGAVYL